ncbi:inositol-trisphosphate 3-kinase A-like isoform X1 [Dinothrombium tinctorium]|uniref:Kinase n=1 Tax=Dinothrombium tinctorium TaxID=1965070 RepID=A0A443QE38_9ACAR|nr:inositol-trisphosphate 3-kinase A-like isoform X1 [Dinothrombium tinctorium]
MGSNASRDQAANGQNQAANNCDITYKKSNSSPTRSMPKTRWKQLTKAAFTKQKQNSFNSTKAINGSADSTNEEANDFSRIQLLALKSLELTAPASDVVLRNRSKNWLQLSGHEGAFAPAAPGTIWKKRGCDDTEVKVYKALVNDKMSEMVPKFYADLEFNGENFIEMQDLLHSFKNPSIMDIKMGTRTFLESEVNNSKARSDLYEKMIKIDPEAATPEENEIRAITKLRYMTFRENRSSSSTLGFRIEGYRLHGKEPAKDLQFVRHKEEVIEQFKKFLPNSNELQEQLINKLKKLRENLMSSEFFKNHEIIGSSLLIIYDQKKVGVWMIDFAKTLPLPKGVNVDHTSPWTLGNHEDGYLFGLSNLINILQEVLNC